MKKLCTTLLLACTVFIYGISAAAQLRIPIQEDKPVDMYALGAGTTAGVFKLNLTDLQTPTKISGSSYISYSGSTQGGGGTFLSSEKIIGIKYYYSTLVFEATAEGTADGPWTASYYQNSYDITKVYDMTYDDKNDIVYCWYQATTYINALGIYNPESHTITRVGNAANTAIYAIAIDTEGQLWGIGTYGFLYSIDKTTGTASELTGSLGCGVQLQNSLPMSAAIDPATGIMYAVGRVGSYDTYSSLIKIDLSTKKAESLGALPGYYNCLYIAGSSISEGAPAPVEDLTAEFNGTATVVTFTAPTLNAGGKTLTGDLTYTVSVDGEETATGTAAPGEVVSVDLTPADGSHEISVTVSNSEGTSKSVKTTVFSGYDQPGAVRSLKATSDNENITLTWDAPQGKNGGEPDFTKLTYTVTCNGETVAEGLTATEFTTPVTGNYRELSFVVTVVYADVTGETAAVSLMAGDPYKTPYTLDLADVTSLGAAGITVIDPNTNNYAASGTWTLKDVDGSKYIESYSSYAFCRDDYFYLPYLQLTAGVKYTLSFSASAVVDSESNKEKLADMRVLIASEPSAVTYTELKKYELTPAVKEYDWTTYTIEFTVETDGNYTLGFLDLAPNWYNFYSLAVKDVTVTREGETSAVDATVAESVEVTAADGTITVRGAKGSNVLVCTTEGRVILSTTASDLLTTPVLAKGIYLVKVGTKTVKIALN